MSERSLSIVILAAGKGTRMKSKLPKVLHRIGGCPMLSHVLALAQDCRADSISVVVGPEMDEVATQVARDAPEARIFIQSEQKGTADAVLAARDALVGRTGPVVVLYADTPLIEAQTISRMVSVLKKKEGIVVLGFEPDDPTGYGRLICNANGDIEAIREEKDASDSERQIRLCNSGVLAFDVLDLVHVLDRISDDNAKKEFYLTDAVHIVRSDGGQAAYVTGTASEVLGVNSREQLAVAEAIWQRRVRRQFMDSGVTMIAPETVWLSYDTQIGRDVTIEPNVVFGPGVVIEDDVEIRANSHLVGIDKKSSAGVRVACGSVIGPYARLRPGAVVGKGAHVGNFVEIKSAELSDGAKVNHLTYVGDALVGEGSNIGAGTIFCNYDGFNKARSELGAGVFIGSNSALVAPVKIGDGAYVAAGSVITKDVEPDSLAIERSEQVEHKDWAMKYRTVMERQKSES